MLIITIADVIFNLDYLIIGYVMNFHRYLFLTQGKSVMDASGPGELGDISHSHLLKYLWQDHGDASCRDLHLRDPAGAGVRPN